MPSSALLTWVVGGNIILLAASTRVHALHVAPPSITPQLCYLVPSSASLSSSTFRLFGNKRPLATSHVYSTCRSALRSSSTPNGSNNAVDAEITESSSPKSSSTSFLQSVDSFGMQLKPWALRAYEKSLQFSNSSNSNDVNGTESTTATTSDKNVNRVKSILSRIQANVFWMLYIIYRGYRGFFVILPAVFREVYRQLEESELALDVFDDEEEVEKEYVVSANAELQQQKKEQPMKWRTRITISVLSGMLTLSYVISGALRVFAKFIKTFTNTASVESSFEAAADEVAMNEDKLRSKLK